MRVFTRNMYMKIRGINAPAMTHNAVLAGTEVTSVSTNSQHARATDFCWEIGLNIFWI